MVRCEHRVLSVSVQRCDVTFQCSLTRSLDSFADTWKRATSQEHFERIIHSDRKLGGTYTFRQLCVRTLRLCKNLPYSPVNWLYLVLLGAICAMYGYVVCGPGAEI